LRATALYEPSLDSDPAPKQIFALAQSVLREWSAFKQTQFDRS